MLTVPHRLLRLEFESLSPVTAAAIAAAFAAAGDERQFELSLECEPRQAHARLRHGGAHLRPHAPPSAYAFP